MGIHGAALLSRSRRGGDSSSAQMVEQIRKTVLHEIGHYFGFDDAYLHAHGY